MISKSMWLLMAIFGATVAFSMAQTDKSKEQEPEGKKILDTACTTCHSLKEVEKFKGFYKKEDWQDVVTTMIKYGAEVKDTEVPVLVEYLAKTYSAN